MSTILGPDRYELASGTRRMCDVADDTIATSLQSKLEGCASIPNATSQREELEVCATTPIVCMLLVKLMLIYCARLSAR